MLLERIRSLLPDGDNMKYKTTESHFDWSKVCFGNFTGDMCRQKWQKVSSEVRKQQVWKMIRATCQNFYLTGFSFNINVFKLLKGTMSQKHKQLSSLLLISINSGYFVKCLKKCLKSCPSILIYKCADLFFNSDDSQIFVSSFNHIDLIQVRKYRTMTELIVDALEFVKNPYKGKKLKVGDRL